MTPEILELLKQVDTPTVCNSIEIAQGTREFSAFTRGTMMCSAPEEGAIVGYARTAKVAAANPPAKPPDVVKAIRKEYYRYMWDSPSPAIAVIEDTDGDNAVGAFWGEINTTVHKSFGISGALTNGSMRDLGALPSGFPVIAGSIGPSHAFVHVHEVGSPVTVFGLTVKEGDLIHADRHGALVIPEDLIDELDAAIERLVSRENLVLEPARKEGFNFEKFEECWSAFESSGN